MAMSDFEGYVLGCLLSGSTSGYAIRLRLERNPVPRWSAESGAVYRVLRRALEHGWIASEGKAGVTNRERTEYSVTIKGESEWARWLQGPVSVSDTDCPDSAAIKSEFLEYVPLADRETVLGAWQKQNRGALKTAKERLNRAKCRCEALQCVYVVERLSARERWLKIVEQQMAVE